MPPSKALYSRRVEQFVYHQLATDFRGTVLYPFNDLATVYPEIYAREAPKYTGRECVMFYRMPHLDARGPTLSTSPC